MTNYSIPIQEDQPENIRCGFVLFDKSPSNFDVWRRLMRGDRSFVSTTNGPFKLYTFTVSGVGITNNEAPNLKSGLIAYFDECYGSRGIRTSLSNVQALSQAKELDKDTVAELNAICIDCLTVTAQKCELDVLPILLPQDYNLNVAIEPYTTEFLKRCADLHPFGGVHEGWPLVLRYRDEMVGGGIVKLGALTNQYHRLERRVFGTSISYLKDHSIHISRVLSKYVDLRRHFIFKQAITGVLLLSKHLLSKPTTFVSGVSYDLIPAAYWVGARIELPDSAYGSLYYWKRFVPESDPLTGDEYTRIRTQFRKIREERRLSNSWIVFGSTEDIFAAQEHSTWLLSDLPLQRVKWHALKIGDHVFLADRTPRLIAVGTVGKKSRRRIRGYERYPLAIGLSKVLEVDTLSSAELSNIVGWLFQQREGGISAIPSDVALEIRDYFYRKIGSSHMWVTPNPMLLHATDFSVVKKQVFVVQSWDLRESVLPAIRVVCVKHGYSVVHAEDRHGQVIFEPIWRMLNESEVVLVDFTNKRPNVYLEYGMALVLGKPIVAITQSEKDVPSDTPNLKWHKYRGEAPLPDLEKLLPGAIAGTIADVDAVRRSVRGGRL